MAQYDERTPFRGILAKPYALPKNWKLFGNPVGGRFNDFVGRIGYLRELEDVYELGYGIHATPLTTDSPIRRADGFVQPSGV